MNYRCVSADPRAVLQTALSGEPRIVLDAELGSQRGFLYHQRTHPPPRLMRPTETQ